MLFVQFKKSVVKHENKDNDKCHPEMKAICPKFLNIFQTDANCQLLRSVVFAISLMAITVTSCKKEKFEFVFTELHSGISRDLNDIYFVDDTTGYVCGGERYNTGDILKTTNSGETWLPQGENLEKALYRINFSRYDTGFIVGFEGKIYRTHNGGSNWNLYQLARYQPLHDIFMVNEEDGYVCGGDGFALGYIYQTHDGGNFWSIDTFPQELRSIFFTGESTGFAAGYGVIFKTNNGGESWQLTDAAGDFFQSVTFTDEQTGYAVGYEGSILKTTDAGASWSKIRNGNILFQATWHLHEVAFRSSATGYIIGEKGCFLKTTDAGEHWEEIKNAPEINFHGIFLSDEGGYLCGEGGKIYRFLE